MTREYVAVLIVGLVVLVLRMGDLLLKWVARKLGVEEIPDRPPRPPLPPPKEKPDE